MSAFFLDRLFTRMDPNVIFGDSNWNNAPVAMDENAVTAVDQARDAAAAYQTAIVNLNANPNDNASREVRNAARDVYRQRDRAARTAVRDARAADTYSVNQADGIDLKCGNIACKFHIKCYRFHHPAVAVGAPAVAVGAAAAPINAPVEHEELTVVIQQPVELQVVVHRN